MYHGLVEMESGSQITFSSYFRIIKNIGAENEEKLQGTDNSIE